MFVVSCLACGKRYQINPASIPSQGIAIACRNCGSQITVPAAAANFSEGTYAQPPSLETGGSPCPSPDNPGQSIQVQCSGCVNVYRVDAAKIPPRGGKVTCKNCRAVMLIKPPAADFSQPAAPAANHAPSSPPPNAPAAPAPPPDRSSQAIRASDLEKQQKALQLMHEIAQASIDGRGNLKNATPKVEKILQKSLEKLIEPKNLAKERSEGEELLTKVAKKLYNKKIAAEVGFFDPDRIKISDTPGAQSTLARLRKRNAFCYSDFIFFPPMLFKLIIDMFVGGEAAAYINLSFLNWLPYVYVPGSLLGVLGDRFVLGTLNVPPPKLAWLLISPVYLAKRLTLFRVYGKAELAVITLAALAYLLTLALGLWLAYLLVL